MAVGGGGDGGDVESISVRGETCWRGFTREEVERRLRSRLISSGSGTPFAKLQNVSTLGISRTSYLLIGNE